MVCALRLVIRPGGGEELIRVLRLATGSSERRRSAYASLLIVEVLTNLSNHEDEKNSSEFFELTDLVEEPFRFFSCLTSCDVRFGKSKNPHGSSPLSGLMTFEIRHNDKFHPIAA